MLLYPGPYWPTTAVTIPVSGYPGTKVQVTLPSARQCRQAACTQRRPASPWTRDAAAQQGGGGARRCALCGGASSTARHLSQGHMNSKLDRWYASQSLRRPRSSGSMAPRREKHSRTHALMERGNVGTSLHTSTCAPPGRRARAQAGIMRRCGQLRCLLSTSLSAMQTAEHLQMSACMLSARTSMQFDKLGSNWTQAPGSTTNRRAACCRHTSSQCR
jgi:hypothetical protein